jgi:hypothetical protein
MTSFDFSSLTIDQLYVQLQSSEKGLSTQLAEDKSKEQAKSFKTESRAGYCSSTNP